MSESVISEETLATERDTEKFAGALAARLLPGMQLALDGELGAGKTTLVRYLCAALGVKGPVSSPTFVLQHCYEGKSISVEHWDLYRVAQCPAELLEPPEPGVIRIVEWASRFSEAAGESDIRVELAFVSGNEKGRTARTSSR
jgi:tRNA threonylcarbamoyladenosine biosynthesis protein TsaE